MGGKGHWGGSGSDPRIWVRILLGLRGLVVMGLGLSFWGACYCRIWVPGAGGHWGGISNPKIWDQGPWTCPGVCWQECLPSPWASPTSLPSPSLRNPPCVSSLSPLCPPVSHTGPCGLPHSMAILVQNLALLAMAMATTAVDVYPLDMAPNSFDDQYRGCGPAMKAALLTLSGPEFVQNKDFADAWVKAAAEWQRRGPPVSSLSPDQATAIMAFAGERTFNDAVRVAGRSSQEYQENFHFKTLHFLLTDALATLRDAQKGQCRDAFLDVAYTGNKAQRGDTIRFGKFMAMFPSKPIHQHPGTTMLEVHTCHGVEIQFSTEHPEVKGVLIPPFETFKITQYTREGDKTQIQLHSSGTYSKYNCEWLRGGSIPSASFHLGGLLLTTAALAVAAGII